MILWTLAVREVPLSNRYIIWNSLENESSAARCKDILAKWLTGSILCGFRVPGLVALLDDRKKRLPEHVKKSICRGWPSLIPDIMNLALANDSAVK
jgi:hypothetical protein